MLWGAWAFLRLGAKSVRDRNPKAAAVVFSVVAAVAPGLIPLEFGAHGRTETYFVAAAFIVSLTLLGKILELRAWSTSRC